MANHPSGEILVTRWRRHSAAWWQRKNEKKSRFNFQTVTGSQPQYDYKLSMNGWSQVITEVEFNRMAAAQGAHHVLHII